RPLARRAGERDSLVVERGQALVVVPGPVYAFERLAGLLEQRRVAGQRLERLARQRVIPVSLECLLERRQPLRALLEFVDLELGQAIKDLGLPLGVLYDGDPALEDVGQLAVC